ncbi:hypothetical protein MVEN_01881500 [Mycena venus]|uniref:Uncharacterized protein n=1 Tax=Mycena venus TaxID=2733690 RepID=A0A8H7CN62_9AGAR|nr:hypothetical protein MVEN_01881500 [Mycena venus]
MPILTTTIHPPGSPSPAPDPALNAGKRRHAAVEEVEDEEDERYVEDFPEDMNAGEWQEHCKTYFQKLRDEQKDAGNTPWYPFETEDEWELAKWLMTLGLSQKKTDEYLKLKVVRTWSESNYIVSPISSRSTRE